MKSEILWLKISYIAGAVADGLVGILLLIPDRMGEAEFRYPMGVAASLMFGWTFLLVWANKKPVERKGVLLLTIFPVITGLLIAGVAAVAYGIFPLNKIIPSSLLLIVLIALFGYSYVKAKKLEG